MQDMASKVIVLILILALAAAVYFVVAYLGGAPVPFPGAAGAQVPVFVAGCTNITNEASCTGECKWVANACIIDPAISTKCDILPTKETCDVNTTCAWVVYTACANKNPKAAECAVHTKTACAENPACAVSGTECKPKDDCLGIASKAACRANAECTWPDDMCRVKGRSCGMITEQSKCTGSCAWSSERNACENVIPPVVADNSWFIVAIVVIALIVLAALLYGARRLYNYYGGGKVDNAKDNKAENEDIISSPEGTPTETLPMSQALQSKIDAVANEGDAVAKYFAESTTQENKDATSTAKGEQIAKVSPDGPMQHVEKQLGKEIANVLGHMEFLKNNLKASKGNTDDEKAVEAMKNEITEVMSNVVKKLPLSSDNKVSAEAIKEAEGILLKFKNSEYLKTLDEGKGLRWHTGKASQNFTELQKALNEIPAPEPKA